MVERIHRQRRESEARGQTVVAKHVGISPAQLARLEANQRGLYVEALESIARALETARLGAAETLLADKLRL